MAVLVAAAVMAAVVAVAGKTKGTKACVYTSQDEKHPCIQYVLSLFGERALYSHHTAYIARNLHILIG